MLQKKEKRYRNPQKQTLIPSIVRNDQPNSISEIIVSETKWIPSSWIWRISKRKPTCVVWNWFLGSLQRIHRYLIIFWMRSISSTDSTNKQDSVHVEMKRYIEDARETRERECTLCELGKGCQRRTNFDLEVLFKKKKWSLNSN